MVKCGIIGCGVIAPTHLAGYNQIPGAKVVGFCDLIREKAEKLAEKMEIPARVGLTVCNDLLYFDNKPEIAKQWNKYGVIGSEQEAVALYALASQFRTKALMIMSVAVNILDLDQPPLSKEAREKELDNMIRLALETAIAE